MQRTLLLVEPKEEVFLLYEKNPIEQSLFCLPVVNLFQDRELPVPPDEIACLNQPELAVEGKFQTQRFASHLVRGPLD